MLIKRFIFYFNGLFLMMTASSITGESGTVQNLLKNPGFEILGEDGFPQEWIRDVTGYKGEYRVKVDPSFAFSGSVSVGISRTGPDAHPSFAAFYSHPITVSGQRRYTLSFMARGKGRFAMTVYLYGKGHFLIPQSEVVGLSSGWIDIDTNKWAKHSVELIIPEEGIYPKTKNIVHVSSFRVALHVSDGLVWFDDASLYFSNSVQGDEINYIDPCVSDFITIPYISPAPEIDGQIQKDEWYLSTATTGFFNLGGSFSERQTIVYVGFDDKNIYVAFYSLHQGKFRKGSLVSEFSQTEVFEVWLVTPDGKLFQVLVGPSGEVRTRSAQKGWNWQSGVVYRCRDEDSGEIMAGSGQLTMDKRIWTGELAIPFNGLGVSPPQDGDVWRINFNRDFSVSSGDNRTDKDWTTWVPLESFNQKEKFGYACFSRKLPGVQIERINDPSGGILSICGRAYTDVGVQSLVILADETKKAVINKVEKAGPVEKFCIEDKIKVSKSTDMELLFAVRDIAGKKLLHQRRIPFTALSAFMVKVAPLYFKNTVRIDIDLTRMSNIPQPSYVEIMLYDRDDVTPRIRKCIAVSSMREILNIDISSLQVGKYSLRAVLKNEKGDVIGMTMEPLFIPEKPKWMGSNLGRSDEVPLPWKPISVKGKHVSVTQREYWLSDNGLPERILSLNEDILAGAVKMYIVINGTKTEGHFKELKLVEQKKDHVAWNISGAYENIDISGTLRIEFDGFAIWRIELLPKKTVTINNLFIEFPFSRNTAYFVRGDSNKSATLIRDIYSEDKNWPEVFTLRDGDPEDGGSRSHSRVGWKWPRLFFYQMVVSNGQKGFAWMTETDENIKGDKYIEFIESANSIVMKVNLISSSFSLNSPLRYEYFYIAMPVKPESADPRRWRAGSLTGSYDISGYNTPEGKEFLDRCYAGLIFGQAFHNMPYPGFKEKIRVSEIRRFRSHGLYPVGNIWYQCAAEITPEYSLFFPEWEAKPEFGWTTPKDGRVHHACLRTSFQDYVVDVVRWMIEEAGYYGIYSDSGPILCGNEVHNCGYIDTNGKRHPTLNVLATREFLRRIYNILKSDGHDYPHYTHTGGHMALISFADVRTEGEEWGAGERPIIFKRLSPDHFRARYAQNDTGIPFTFYTLPKEQQRVPLREVLMITLPHRVGYCFEGAMDAADIVPVWDLFEEWWTAAEFIPYWNQTNPVTTTNPQSVLSSTYLKKREGKALVVVSNWNFEPVKVGVSIDWEKIGFGPVPIKVVDPISKKEIIHKPSNIAIEIPARDFRVILLQK
ncbi:MAG TPA: DUF6067 family protein [bacterium]|nr:DUF6067 family protein [bacterium]HPP30304.1 DUF6067 family protein [bacterium]